MIQLTNPATISVVYIPVELLKYDPLNPRLPNTVKSDDDDEVLAYMLDDGNIIELMGSIGEQGYSPNEPIIVVKNSDETYDVVEGNRRLTAVRLLLHPELAPTHKISVQTASSEAKFKPSMLPAIIYPRRRDILEYLGFRHITGVKTWGPLEKAKFLRQLQETVTELDVDDQYRRLAKVIGSRADYVKRLLSGYRVYEDIVQQNFFGIKGIKEDDVDFSVLTTALSYSSIADHIGVPDEDQTERPETSIPVVKELDKDKLRELTAWMFEKSPDNQTRLGESRNLKQLSQVVSSDKALLAFRSGRPLLEAVKLTKAPTEGFRHAINDALSRLEDARGLMHLVDEPARSDADILLEIYKLARAIKAGVDEKLLEIEAA